MVEEKEQMATGSRLQSPVASIPGKEPTRFAIKARIWTHAYLTVIKFSGTKWKIKDPSFDIK